MIDYGENAEFITVRLCFGLESIRLILAYGPQEGDAKDEIEDFYENLQIQIDRSVLKGDSVLLVGDLNAKLGKTVINRDIHDMSANGKLLYNIINKYNLCVVNALRLCKGVFTRVNNKNSAEKSVLDYVIVSSNLSDNIQSMTIDEGKLFTPWRNLQSGKRFTYHNTIIFELQCERSKVMTRAIGKWLGILTMIRDGKSFVSSLEMTHPFLRYGRVAVTFRSVTKIGKVG